MEIQEALAQIKQVPSVLEAFKSIEAFLELVTLSQEANEGLIATKDRLEVAISEKTTALAAIENQFAIRTAEISENFDRVKAANKDAIHSLRETLTREQNELRETAHAEAAILNEKVSALKVESKNLTREIEEGKMVLADLNKSIEELKAKFK